jgi:hypothetical protein
MERYLGFCIEIGQVHARVGVVHRQLGVKNEAEPSPTLPVQDIECAVKIWERLNHRCRPQLASLLYVVKQCASCR